MEAYGYNAECEYFEIYLLCHFRGREGLENPEVSPLQKKAALKAWFLAALQASWTTKNKDIAGPMYPVLVSGTFEDVYQ